MLTGPLAQRRALLARVADAGLDHVFVADHVSFHTGFGMDGIVQAATLAAPASARLAVQIGVYLLALRHPVLVARQLATLCESAPGRLVLGVGVGGEDRHEIEICGVDPATRGRRTDEIARGAARAAHGAAVLAPLRVLRVRRRRASGRRPIPPVPIVVGGRSDAALRRAARHGDGWLGVWCSPARYAQVLARIDAEAAAAGRRDVALAPRLADLGRHGRRSRARARAPGGAHAVHVPHPLRALREVQPLRRSRRDRGVRGALRRGRLHELQRDGGGAVVGARRRRGRRAEGSASRERRSRARPTTARCASSATATCCESRSSTRRASSTRSTACCTTSSRGSSAS